MKGYLKTVLVDMDGVLADTLPGWLETYNLFSGEDLQVQDIRGYGFESYVKQTELFFNCLDKGLVFLHAPPMPGALEGFERLCDEHSVYVVTYNHESARTGFNQKLAWLAKHAPWFPPSRVIFTKHKHLVAGDVLIEDSPENLFSWLASHPDGQGILVDHLYNEESSFKRVLSINEVEL